MIISDLSYLNAVSEENVSGAHGYNGSDFKFDKKIDVKVNIDVDSKVDAKGAFNELFFDLTAVGKYGSGTEVAVEQAAVYDDYRYVSAQKGTAVSFAY